MKILVIGSGAREHALAATLARDPSAPVITCAPGNAGMAARFPCRRVNPGDPEALLALARAEGADLTVVGPELPLSVGAADAFAAAGLALVGPTRGAARLEASKVWAKRFMARHRVPTAPFLIADSPASALETARAGTLGWPLVIKADGLAAGKGVVLAADVAEAEATIAAMMTERRFGDAGATLVLEACLTGVELSFFVLADGVRGMPLASAQDHKRALDDDRGPNTGGMGAFAPSPLCDAALERRIMDAIVAPVLEGMRAEGHPYRGFLYCGLMLTADGPQVIEFNVRLGDPEAQVMLPLVDEPLLPLLQASAGGTLPERGVRLRPEPQVGVVIASGGYPDAFETGRPIEGLAEASALPGVQIFHAGTALRDGRLVTAGGRVLTVVGGGPDYAAAMRRAYDAVDRIHFEGMHARRDIGRKAVART